MRNFLKYSVLAIATVIASPAAFADSPAPRNDYINPQGTIAVPMTRGTISDRTVSLYREPTVVYPEPTTSTKGEPSDRRGN